MLLTTRALLSLKPHGPPALALLDACAAARPALFAQLMRHCRCDEEPLAAEKLAIAISNHGRLHRGERGWEWYTRWCEAYDEAGFVQALVDHMLETILMRAAPPPRRAGAR